MSVPIKDRGRYTKSCPGWAITKKWLQEKLLAYVIEEPEDNTNSTITNPIELVTEDTPPMTPEVELKPLEEKIELPVASYTATPQINFDEDKQVWLINKTNNMEIVKKVWGMLEGKKTVITGLLMVALGLLQGNAEMVMTGLGFIFLRMKK